MMRKWFLGALMALMVGLFAAGALADGEGVVVNSSCNIVQSGEYYLVHCYAQIHNNSNQIICLEQGTFELHNGEQLLASQAVSQIWPYFINPGEDGYVFDVVAFEPDENGQPVVPTVTGVVYDIRYMTVDTQFASEKLTTEAEIVRDAAGGMDILCRVTNTTAMDAYDSTLAFALYTQSGNMIYADGTTLKDVGIPVGGTILLRFPVEDELVKQWDSYGMRAPEVRVTAPFRHDED